MYDFLQNMCKIALLLNKITIMYAKSRLTGMLIDFVLLFYELLTI